MESNEREGLNPRAFVQRHNPNAPDHQPPWLGGDDRNLKALFLEFAYE